MIRGTSIPHQQPTKRRELGREEGITVGFRVLPDEGHGQWVEVSQQAWGEMFGLEVTDLLTYKYTVLNDGSLYGEVQGIRTLSDGSSSTWKATGTGTRSIPGGPQVWTLTAQFTHPTGRFRELEGRGFLAEHRVGVDGRMVSRLFETQ